MSHEAARPAPTLAPATIREQQSLNERLRACGGDVIKVEQSLAAVIGRTTMANLTKLAQMCSTATNGQIKPDRLARRHRQGMLCFFCTHWQVVSQVISRDMTADQLASIARVGTPTSPTDPLSISALLNH